MKKLKFNLLTGLLLLISVSVFAAGFPPPDKAVSYTHLWGMLMEKEAYASGAITSGLLDWSTPVSYTHLCYNKIKVYLETFIIIIAQI